MTGLDATFTPAGRTYAETDFEKGRGISQVDLLTGYAGVHIGGLPGDAMEGRLRILDTLAGAGVSINFLKLTPGGMSFLIAESAGGGVASALKSMQLSYSLDRDRAILLVYAVNMRDEEGMIAGILREAIGSGVQIDHASDMHDRMLLVLAHADGERLAQSLLREIPTEEESGDGAPPRALP